MTGPNDTTRPISVAELLAKNGTHGAPAPARRRRRRGNSDAVTVAELTGEIPIITDDMEPEKAEQRGPGSHVHRAHGTAHVDDEVAQAPADAPAEKSSYWSAPEPRAAPAARIGARAARGTAPAQLLSPPGAHQRAARGRSR